jgi:hypothetical protein
MCLLLGASVGAAVIYVQNRRLELENHQLRAELAALTREHTGALERLETFRSEIAILRDREKQQAAFGPEEQARRGAVEPHMAVPQTPVSERRRLEPEMERLSPEKLPSEVLAALFRKAGQLDIQELELVTEDGLLLYQVQGLTSDGRRVGLRVSPDGRIVSGKSEVAPEALPEAVREAVAQGWGEVTLAQAGEVLQKDQATYHLGGSTTDGRKFKLSLAADGKLLSATTEVRPGNLPDAVRNAIGASMEAGATPVIREVYAGERLTYDVGTKSEAGKIRMVLAQDGTLVGFESWSSPPKSEK